MLLLCLLPFSVQATIYKTTDDQGNVTYSDSKPVNKTAEKVKLKPIAPLGTSTVTTYKPTVRNENKPSVDVYSDFRIIEPADNATVHNGGNFTVKVALSPRLASGHRIRLTLDGKVKEKPKRSLNFTLLNVERGSHSLSAEVISSDGKVIKAANSRVHVKRTIYTPPVSIN